MRGLHEGTCCFKVESPNYDYSTSWSYQSDRHSVETVLWILNHALFLDLVVCLPYCVMLGWVSQSLKAVHHTVTPVSNGYTSSHSGPG